MASKRKPKIPVLNPEPTFIPVHAASMSTPVFAQMVKEFGEPDLNPHDDLGPDFGLEDLFAQHQPDVSMRAFVPAWAANTGQFIMDRAALEQFRSKMAMRDEEAEIGQQDRSQGSVSVGS